MLVYSDVLLAQETDVLATQSNEILTAIVHGMKKEEPSDYVRLAATNALLNSLEFTKANFEVEVLSPISILSHLHTCISDGICFIVSLK